MNKKIFSMAFFALLVMSVIGQNSVDVLRYSQTFRSGSARFNAMGSSFGALGGDFSSLAINPAGIGIYQKSEYIFTPAVFFSKSDATTNTFNGIGTKNNINFNNAGVVATSRFKREKGWRSFQFGFGFNRINNFNREINILNHNNFGSLITDYQTQAYGLNPNQLDAFTTDLAWKTYLFDDTTRVNNGVLAYTSYLANGGTKQVERILQWGSVNEMLFVMGGSYEDKLYIGGAIGVPFARFFEQVRHTEYDDTDSITSFDSFVMNRYLETHGTGINFKLGIIARPVAMLRFGLNFESPTWYSLNDYFYNDMKQYFDGGTSTSVYTSPKQEYNYHITTPMKVGGSMAVVVGQIMIFNIDAEYLDYREGFLNSSDYAYFDENEDVELKLNSALNLRAGMEIRLKPIAFRLGVASYGNPYKSDINDAKSIQYSGGIGFRDENMFFDLAYVYSKHKEDYYMYDPYFTPASKIENKTHQISASLGFKF